MTGILKSMTAIAAGALLSLMATMATGQANEAEAISNLMMQTFDRPEARLTVAPITVSGEVAVAGWAQGEMGGRALLHKVDGGWKLVLCSGDALKDAGALRQFGLAAEQASAMAAEIAASEASLDPTLVEKFSHFDGIVMMDRDGAHPPANGHGQHAQKP